MILVTGSAGFIGFHLVKRLLKIGNTVLGLDNLNDYYDIKLKKDRLKKLGINVNLNDIDYSNNSFSFIIGDLSDQTIWKKINKFNITAVIHLAAQAGVRYSLIKPFEYINSNIVGFQNVLEYCDNNKINNLIYASSSSVYGKSKNIPFTESDQCVNPESLYAATKRSNELFADVFYKTKGLSSIGLRFFTVYGPWGRPDMAPFLFTKSALKKEKIKVFNHGDQKRDFTYIDDIVDGIVQVFNSKDKITGSEIFNIGRGNPVNLMDFINIIEKNLNIEIKKEMMEAQIGDVELTYSSTKKLNLFTGYNPKISLEEGINKFIKWYLDYYN